MSELSIGFGAISDDLKDDDFFGVSTHKEATLEFSSKSELKDGQYLVSGQLTIKGITNPIDFTIEPKNDHYVAILTFDRTKYDVTYRSGNFFENLGDRLILDEVELLVDLVK